jgi:hypothetical protein
VDTTPLFSHASLVQLFIATLVVSILALEAGYRLGTRRRSRPDFEKDAPVSTSVGATLGLLAFMLAMTFGVAMGQFDIRRQAFIDEVDAIGTAYRRSDFLSLDLSTKSKQTLKEYVAARLRVVDTGDLQAANIRSQQLHNQLWSIINSAKEQTGNHVLLSLYISSIGEVMDLHTRRVVAAVQLRIPTIIWIVLYSVACLGLTEMGYQTGITGSTRSLAFLGLVISFAAVLSLIADLDRPREGAISVSQKAMRELYSTMDEVPEGPANP